MNYISNPHNKTESETRTIYEELTLREKNEIGRVIKDCKNYCDDVSIIFYLYKEKDFTISRHTFPFHPDMEFLIVTNAQHSATTLFSKLVDERASSLASIFAHDTLTNHVVISTEDFVEGVEGMELFTERLFRSLIVYEGS